MAPSKSARLSVVSLFVYSATAFALPPRGSLDNPQAEIGNLAQAPNTDNIAFDRKIVPRFSRILGGWPGVQSQSAGAINHLVPTANVEEISRTPTPTSNYAGAVRHTGSSNDISSVVSASVKTASKDVAETALSSEPPAVTTKAIWSMSLDLASMTPLETIPDPRHSEAMSKLTTHMLDNTGMYTLLGHSSLDAASQSTGLDIPFLSVVMEKPTNSAAPKKGPVPMAISIIDDPVPTHAIQPLPLSSVKASAAVPTSIVPKTSIVPSVTPASAFSVAPAISSEAPAVPFQSPSVSMKASVAQPLKSQASMSVAASSVSELAFSMLPLSKPSEPAKASAESSKLDDEPKATLKPSPSASSNAFSAAPVVTSNTPQASSQALVTVKASSPEPVMSSVIPKAPIPSTSAIFFTIRPSNSMAIIPSISFVSSVISSPAVAPSTAASLSLESSASAAPSSVESASLVFAPSASKSMESSLSASAAPSSQSMAAPNESDAPKASLVPSSSSSFHYSIRTSAASSAAEPSTTPIVYSIRTSASASEASSSAQVPDKPKSESPTTEPPTSPTPSSNIKSSAPPSGVVKSSAAPSSAESKESPKPSSSAPSSSSATAQTTAKPELPGKPVGVVVMNSVTYTIGMLSDGNLQFGNGAVVTANAPEMVVDGQTLSFGTNGFIVNHSSTFPIKATNTGTLTPTAAASQTAVASGAPNQPKAPAGGNKPSSTRTGNGISSPTGAFSQGTGMRLDSSSAKVGTKGSVVALICGLVAVVYFV